MGILLSYKLGVASILCLARFASLESEFSDPTSLKSLEDKPLPIKISSVLYRSVCINIYDSQTTSRNKKIYFYSPIAVLNHMNVISVFHQTSTQGFLSISFAIWNQEIRTKVVQHLTQIFNQQIEPNQVRVFHFNSVRLTGSKLNFADFSLTNEWVAYKDQPSLRFSLICPTREDCDRVKTEMLSNPKQFEHLRLDFNPELKDGTYRLIVFFIRFIR
jgi:hypothetical protein